MSGHCQVLSLVVGLAVAVPAIGAAAQNSSSAQPTISGVVLSNDGKTAFPNMRLQLRNIDTGVVVASTVSDGAGAFAFIVGVPGVYVVEALDDRGVRAITGPVTAQSGTVVNVVMPSAAAAIAAGSAGVIIAGLALGGTAYEVLVAATAAGSSTFGAGGAVSPER